MGLLGSCLTPGAGGQSKVSQSTYPACQEHAVRTVKSHHAHSAVLLTAQCSVAWPDLYELNKSC